MLKATFLLFIDVAKAPTPSFLINALVAACSFSNHHVVNGHIWCVIWPAYAFKDYLKNLSIARSAIKTDFTLYFLCRTELFDTEAAFV